MKHSVERRFVPAQFRISDDPKPRLQGYALKFHEPSCDLGGWTEVILPGSVVLADDVQALYDHDDGKLLGRTRSGTLQLNIDDVGLWFDLDPPDTTVGRDAVELIRRGDIAGCSFGFYELDGEWNQTDGGLIRELKQIHVFEITLTPSPAYESTEVALRSLDKWREQVILPTRKAIDRYRRLLATHEKYFLPY